MIPTTAQGYNQLIGMHTAGWVASCLLHAGLLLGAAVFVRHVQLAPQPTPFTWDVAMVSPAHSAAASVAQTISAPQSQTKTANPTVPVPPQPPRPKLQPAPVQPIQPPAPAVAITPPPPVPNQDSKPITQPPPVIATTTPPAKQAEPMVPEQVKTPPVEPHHQTNQADSPPVSARIERITPPEVQAIGPEPAPSVATVSPPTPSVEAPPQTANTGSPVEIASETAASPAPQAATIAPMVSGRPARMDYGWLSETILRRVEELKRYPAEARLDRAEGKVVLKAVIRDDGAVDDVEIFQSSGYRILDLAAVDLMKQAAPFQLPLPLGKSKITVKIPMSYRLDR